MKKFIDLFKLFLMGLGLITLGFILLFAVALSWPKEQWEPVYEVGDCLSMQLQDKIFTLKIKAIDKKKESYTIFILGDPQGLPMKIPREEFEDDRLDVIKETCPISGSSYQELSI